MARAERLRIEYISIDELIPYDNNPRNNEQAVGFLANDIREFGFNVPIIIDKNKVIVCGHTRRLAALRLGLKEVPCICVDDLSEEQVKAFRLADNKVAEFSKWDMGKLSEELESLDWDMGEFGFAVDINFSDIEEDDEDDEPAAVEDAAGSVADELRSNAAYYFKSATVESIAETLQDIVSGIHHFPVDWGDISSIEDWLKAPHNGK